MVRLLVNHFYYFKQESEKTKIEDICREITTRTRLFPDFEETSFNAALELINHLKVEEIEPDDSWQPITSLNKHF